MSKYGYSPTTRLTGWHGFCISAKSPDRVWSPQRPRSWQRRGWRSCTSHCWSRPAGVTTRFTSRRIKSSPGNLVYTKVHYYRVSFLTGAPLNSLSKNLFTISLYKVITFFLIWAHIYRKSPSTPRKPGLLATSRVRSVLCKDLDRLVRGREVWAGAAPPPLGLPWSALTSLQARHILVGIDQGNIRVVDAATGSAGQLRVAEL